MRGPARFAAFSASGAIAAWTPSAAWAELRGTIVDHGVTGVGFTFDNLWELEPGPWCIVASARGAELASQACEVVLGPPGSPRSDCPGATDA